eukprot:1149229-Pelagomonas_calceolata.AAC.1
MSPAAATPLVLCFTPYQGIQCAPARLHTYTHTHLLPYRIRADVKLDDFEHKKAPIMPVAHFLGDAAGAAADHPEVLQILQRQVTGAGVA